MCSEINKEKAFEKHAAKKLLWGCTLNLGNQGLGVQQGGITFKIANINGIRIVCWKEIGMGVHTNLNYLRLGAQNRRENFKIKRSKAFEQQLGKKLILGCKKI